MITTTIPIVTHLPHGMAAVSATFFEGARANGVTARVRQTSRAQGFQSHLPVLLDEILGTAGRGEHSRNGGYSPQKVMSFATNYQKILT